MLDETDIKKLSEVFIARDDFKHEIGYLNERISVLNGRTIKTDERAYRLEENGRELKATTERIAEKVSGHEEQLNRLEENSKHIREVLEGMVTGIDAIAGGMSDLRMEYVAIKTQQNRHEERLVQLEQ